METLVVFLDAPTMARLRKASEETGRDLHTLASDGVAEYMLQGFRARPEEDPARFLQ